MNMKEDSAVEESLISDTHLTLRRNLGIIGIALAPLLICLNHFRILPSISHYYYSESNVLFIGLLFAYGLYLFSYRGYKKDKTKLDFINDNWVTNFAGILIIIVAFIPTKADHQLISTYHLFNPPRGHNNNILNTIHLICATGFFIIMAYLSYFRFTRTDNLHETEKERMTKKRRNRMYRTCAIMVIVSLLFILVFEFLLTPPFSQCIVLIGEAVALFFFGLAWLVKSKSLAVIKL